MNNMIKQTVKSSLLGGILFAELMAVDNYYGGKEFMISKFLTDLLIFGVIFGLLMIYNQKQLEKEKIN